MTEELSEKMAPNVYFIIGAAVLVVSAIARFLAYSTITTDYTYFVSKWFDVLRTNSGLTAFTWPFSDYAPLYLYFIKILTFIPVYSLYSSKTLSLIFDVLSAYICYVLLKKTIPSYTSGKLFLAAAVIVSIPTVVINSSLWGQSDSIYAAGVIAALYFIILDNPLCATIALSLAMSVKLQAIFFLPVLGGYLIAKKRQFYLALIPCIFFISVIPAWIGGGSLGYWLPIYLHQSGEYTGLSVSAQSMFSFVMYAPISLQLQTFLFWIGIVLGLIVSVFVGLLMAKATNELSPRRIVCISLVSVLLLPFVLPRMHERYFYMADIFSVLYAWYEPKYWYIPVIVVSSSLLSYMPFLSQQVWYLSGFHVDLRLPALLLTVVLGILLYILYKEGDGKTFSTLLKNVSYKKITLW